MARKARLYQIEHSLVYHLINRGVIRQTIFHDQGDVDQFLSLIERYQKRFSFQVYHWCIMGNHYHLVMELLEPRDVSKIIGAIQQIYAFYHHERHKTAGQLFQSRFKSQAIDKSSYLLACGRYVEQNPFRASLVKLPWQWPWSSAQYYALEKKDAITEPNPEWQGSSEDYQRWLLEKDEEEESLFRSSKEAIGKGEFLKQLVKTKGRIRPRGKGRPRGIIL